MKYIIVQNLQITWDSYCSCTAADEQTKLQTNTATNTGDQQYLTGYQVNNKPVLQDNPVSWHQNNQTF